MSRLGGIEPRVPITLPRRVVALRKAAADPRTAPTPEVEAERLRARAVRHYPDSVYLQTEWLRAVTVVRATTRGWLLERPTQRQEVRP